MKVNQLRAGTLLSYVNLAIGSIIPMIYTPIMLRMLGQAEYGLYSLSNSIWVFVIAELWIRQYHHQIHM